MKTKLHAVDLVEATQLMEVILKEPVSYQRAWNEMRYVIQILEFDLKTGARKPSRNNLYDLTINDRIYAVFEVTP